MTENNWMYHVTSISRLGAIAAEGLRAQSYWTDKPSVARYYEEVTRDEGDVPVVLTLPKHILLSLELKPDMPSIYEPITTAIQQTEDEVWEAWEASDKTALDSLSIVGSCVVVSPVTPDLLAPALEALVSSKEKVTSLPPLRRPVRP